MMKRRSTRGRRFERSVFFPGLGMLRAKAKGRPVPFEQRGEVAIAIEE